MLKYSQKFSHIKKLRFAYETETSFTYSIDGSVGSGGIGSGYENIKIKIPKKQNLIGQYKEGIVEDLVYET